MLELFYKMNLMVAFMRMPPLLASLGGGLLCPDAIEPSGPLWGPGTCAVHVLLAGHLTKED